MCKWPSASKRITAIGWAYSAYRVASLMATPVESDDEETAERSKKMKKEGEIIDIPLKRNKYKIQKH